MGNELSFPQLDAYVTATFPGQGWFKDVVPQMHALINLSFAAVGLPSPRRLRAPVRAWIFLHARAFEFCMDVLTNMQRMRRTRVRRCERRWLQCTMSGVKALASSNSSVSTFLLTPTSRSVFLPACLPACLSGRSHARCLRA